MNRDDVFLWLSMVWFVGLCGAAIWAFISLYPHRVSVSKGVVMMIQPKQSDNGREVIYRVHSNAEAEEGVITRFNETYVFVRFGKDKTSVVTTRDQLEWNCDLVIAIPPCH